MADQRTKGVPRVNSVSLQGISLELKHQDLLKYLAKMITKTVFVKLR